MRLPAQHVEDAASAADFYANKVLMEWRAKDPHHATWVTSLKALLTALKEYCGQYFPAGPTWNSGGMPLQGYTPGSTGGAGTAPSKPKAGRAPPPPPPPPPPPGLLDQMAASKGVSAGEGGKSSDGSGGAMAALFAEINKGTAVTSGLKKVTDDMKAKNRAAEERTGTVPAGAVLLKAAAPAPARASAGASAPARLECEQGRKWVVENFSGREDLVVADTEPKQTVYVYNCHRCTVQVRGKVNAITLDKCSKVGLLFDTVVSSCEVVNCTGVQVQFTGLAPTLAVDSSDGCQLFIPQAALQAVELTTAKSSELNVVALAGEGDGEAEPQEWAIPEQFVSRYVGGKFVTEPVQHSAG